MNTLNKITMNRQQGDINMQTEMQIFFRTNHFALPHLFRIASGVCLVSDGKGKLLPSVCRRLWEYFLQ